MTNTGAEHNEGLQPLLGELLSFISRVAVAIRMNSSYNCNPDQPEQLLDSGECFIAALFQAGYWTDYQDNIVKSSGGHFDIAKGITLLKDIATTALPSVNVV